MIDILENYQTILKKTILDKSMIFGLKKYIKILGLISPTTLMLASSCIFGNNEPNHIVFKNLKQKYWHKDFIDIEQDWIYSKKRFINKYNTDKYYENNYPEDEYEFMNAYRKDSSKLWEGWNVKIDGLWYDDSSYSERIPSFYSYKGIENIRGYDLFYVKKDSLLFDYIKKIFPKSDKFILANKFIYINSFEERPKQYIALRNHKMIDNTFFLETFNAEYFDWYDSKYRREHQNLYLEIIKHDLPYDKFLGLKFVKVDIWRKLNQYLVIPTDISLEDFNKIKHIEIKQN
ncbi:hypothetical protein [Mycoplasmopsis felis]|uniref:hypothetical protein n=1 Tax=Mycoplasmopsis felis TaxID=33923 RepID=UPI002AF6B5D1|nr:hypothetical protein [Mycoplasmopsis felis]WQQ01587.1 hypothetical protein RRG54_03290 [Mycoplasmopsis felis]WQQ02796.1 hypothetical protein RNN91_01795 [Mycoplasmopsis felis]WQQ06971.1 hypothetical protein RRG37_03920 [Mycoplasmopsis felis]WQQ08767.1 hypothetical protein RRG61_01460 [Mycoplasmopsis felis]WQQ10862.1 hypothetical protein RRG45_03795 [Mycoplasmopsis felis]